METIDNAKNAFDDEIDTLRDPFVQVQIQLFAFFREGRFIQEDREFTDGITAGEIIDFLGIEREEVGVLMLNSKQCQFETVLQDGDVYSIFPIISGG